MEFQSVVKKFDSELWYYHITVPADVAEKFIEGDNRRVICTLEGKIKFNCALMHDGAGAYFINLNKARRQKLGLVLEQVVRASLEKDNSTYGMPMSEELQEVLNQDDEAKANFAALTPGKQRTLIYWTDNVKSSEIKIRRALVMTNHLIEQKGGIDFKQMNAALKEANQRAKRGR